MQQTPLELSRLNLVLLSRQLVDHRHANSTVSDSVAQLGGEIPLNLLAVQVTDSVEQGSDLDLGASLAKKSPPRPHCVARIPFTHQHLIGSLIGTGRGNREGVTDGPKTQQADAILSLQTAAGPLCFQVPLDRIANVRSDVLEVRKPVGGARHTVSVILDHKTLLAVLAAAGDHNGLGVRVDAVLNELGDSL